MDVANFIHDLTWSDIPPKAQDWAGLCLLDLIGIAVAGSTTKLSGIIRDHCAEENQGPFGMMVDGRGTNAAGYALAAGMTIDALDGHDGYNPAKGHVGCGVLPAALAFAQKTDAMDGTEFLTALVLGYELGSRLGPALHATTPDYHTSGAWIAVAGAALGARALKLNHAQTEHAMGIAEYHGPRSQMMRCIDHPTMVKDGSGWGAMTGVDAALLAQKGFTGGPALTTASPQVLWADLGKTWLIEAQYFKPWPVCRWAQGPVTAALAIRSEHNLTSADIQSVAIHTFHESTRLAINAPETTEEAQYSTSFPVAIALARGDVTPNDIADEALRDPEILRLSKSMNMFEDEAANAAFPHNRLARVQLTLTDGRELSADCPVPKWGPEAPPSSSELREKYRGLVAPLMGHDRAQAIEQAVDRLRSDGLSPLLTLLNHPIVS